MQNILKNNKIYFFPVYLLSFLITYHGAIALYINSSFVGKFVSETAIGFVYTLASLIIILMLTQFPKILSRFGNYKAMLGVVLLQGLSLVLLSFSLHPILLLFIFILMQGWLVLLGFNLDVFLEKFSTREKIGTIRGIFLTIASLAVLLGPLTAGFIISDENFGDAYLFSALFLIPVLFVAVRRLRNFKDPEYRLIPYIKTVKNILFARHPNDLIRHAFAASLLLKFFFSWMVIYTPLYLSRYAGFEWSEIGIILSIMLLPYVLLEAPLGMLSDTKFGEKKIMMMGFVILALFTAALFFVNNSSLFVWAALLFGTRIGASFIEVASESFFFKHVETEDTESLSVFRDSQPIASILGPLSASLLLIVVDMKYLFLILALIMLSGLWVAGNMKQNSPVDRATSS